MLTSMDFRLCSRAPRIWISFGSMWARAVWMLGNQPSAFRVAVEAAEVVLTQQLRHFGFDGLDHELHDLGLFFPERLHVFGQLGQRLRGHLEVAVFGAGAVARDAAEVGVALSVDFLELLG